MPGVTMRKPGPTCWRIQLASRAEATIPSTPASFAMSVSRPTSSRTDRISRFHTAAISLGVNDVRTVTARSFRSPDRAATAASIIRGPPDACSVSSSAPRSDAASTACATVFGMSCSLRSRKTRFPRATSSRTTPGPPRVYSSKPTL